MKFSPMVFAAALALSGQAIAGEQDAVHDERYVDNMVECITDFITSELDSSRKDAFVAECMQKKVAKSQQPAATNRKG